jgi:hypothetical protein
MDAYLSKWMGYARLMDVPMPPEKEGFTRWQLVYIQRLVKEAMFADLGVKKSEYVLAQAATENEFDRTLEVLIEGSVISETPKEKTVCSLHEFYEVKHYWEVLERELTKFRRHQPSEIDAPLVSLRALCLNLFIFSKIKSRTAQSRFPKLMTRRGSTWWKTFTRRVFMPNRLCEPIWNSLKV